MIDRNIFENTRFNRKFVIDAGKMKKWLGGITVKKLSLVVSVLYFIGVVIMLQYNSLIFGDIDFNFVRIKPILVGLQYLTYLGVPFAVVEFPFLIARFIAKQWNLRNRWIKLGIALLLLIAMFCAVAIMLHYFFPFCQVAYLEDKGVLVNYIILVWSFWRLYLYWGGHLIGFVLLASGLVLICRKKRQKWMGVALVILGFIYNMFFFTRDVYMNISQAIGGGAPIPGMITITNPAKMLRKDANGKTITTDEVLRFCTIMQSDDTFIWINNVLLSDKGIRSGFHQRNIWTQTRIRKEDVKQFSPINHQWLYRNMAPVWGIDHPIPELIYTLDAFVEFKFPETDFIAALRSAAFFDTTNKIESIWFANGVPVEHLLASDQRIVIEDGTNLCYTVEFQNVPAPVTSTTKDIQNLFFNTNGVFAFRIENLPFDNAVNKSLDMSLGFVINQNSVLKIRDWHNCKVGDSVEFIGGAPLE